MAAKIMNISLKQTSIKVKHWKSLMDSQLLFFADFYHCGFTRNNNLNYLPPTPPDSSEKERIKNVWNNILIAPKKVPQKHNGILKFAQFIYFLQQLACLFCTITFPSLYLWTMPMDHLAWIMSWVPFFIQVPFFPFWWANENKSSLLTHERILVLFSWWKKKMILPITYYLLYFVWRNITLFCVCVFLV